MRKINSITLTVLAIFLTASGSLAQGRNSNNISIVIPEVVLLSLKSMSSGGIHISPQAPNEAGLALDLSNMESGEVWVNYSSVVKGQPNAFRHLDVLMEGDLPPGLSLKLGASPDAGYGNGKLGTPTPEIILTGSQQEIVSNIGSCYTGTGFGKGHKLSYSVVENGSDSYSEIQSGEYVVRITFTLTDEG
jgi:hypothetical protein